MLHQNLDRLTMTYHRGLAMKRRPPIEDLGGTLKVGARQGFALTFTGRYRCKSRKGLFEVLTNLTSVSCSANPVGRPCTLPVEPIQFGRLAFSSAFWSVAANAVVACC